MLALDWWWVVPAVAGAGAVVAGGRWMLRARSDRWLAVDAARADLRRAQQAVGERRRAVKVARAEHARLVASRAPGAEVAGSRRALKQAEKDAKAAGADVRARRVHLSVARAEVPAGSALERFPLRRLRAAHDAVTARWMQYETDPARAIAYPAMSDGKVPATAAYLTAARRAQELRPADDGRVTPAEFGAYRDAVTELERAFEIAEHTAHALAAGRNPDAGGWQDAHWQEAAQQVFARSAEAIDKATSAAASAIAAWQSRNGRKQRDDDAS